MCLMRMTTRSETSTKESYSNGLVIYKEGGRLVAEWLKKEEK